jgi:phytoene dehydrogenase-like protein
MSSTFRVNVAVVGAGLGGLSAAIALVRAGHRVTIVEQAPKLGEVSTSMAALAMNANLSTGWRWHTSPPKLVPYPGTMGDPATAKKGCHAPRIHGSPLLP